MERGKKIGTVKSNRTGDHTARDVSRRLPTRTVHHWTAFNRGAFV
jgi:hypothetical protein